MNPGNLALLLLAAVSLNGIADVAQSGICRLQNEANEVRAQRRPHRFVEASSTHVVAATPDRGSMLVMDCRFGDKLLSVRCQHKACSVLVSGQA